MTRSLIASALVSLVGACEPDEPDEPEPPPGALEYEHPYARIYRLDRRVDIVLVENDSARRECGVLSERAHGELEATLGALDPREDYAFDPEAAMCDPGPGAWVHIEGFDHSPFACDWRCCHRDLARAALIYMLVEYHFLGEVLSFDGEPYIAIEPETPCP